LRGWGVGAGGEFGGFMRDEGLAASVNLR